MIARISIVFLLLALLGGNGLAFAAATAGPTNAFTAGNTAYAAGRFTEAAEWFHTELQQTPSAEALRNLGNAQWQDGKVGPAILAWERAQWINPRDAEAGASLRFARSLRELTTPTLRWWELFSTYLPSEAWGWLAVLSFWSTLCFAVIFPVTMGWRRTGGQQSFAAIGLGIFLLAVTGLAGVQTRLNRAIITSATVNLLQAPALHAPVAGKLAAGDAVRVASARGHFYYLHTGTGETGWVVENQLKLIADSSSK